VRHREDRRPEIEFEALHIRNVELAARLVAFLEHGHVVTVGGETDRRG
jgi:hypothetical protein